MCNVYMYNVYNMYAYNITISIAQLKVFSCATKNVLNITILGSLSVFL